MKKKKHIFTHILTLLFSFGCLFMSAQQAPTTAAQQNYTEEFIAHAKELYDWNIVEKEFISRTHTDLTTSYYFFRYIFKNDMVSMYPFLAKVQEGSITKANAVQYWLDQVPVFEKLYQQEKNNFLPQNSSTTSPVSDAAPTSCNNLDFTDGLTNWSGKYNNMNNVNHYKTAPDNLPASTLNSSGGTDGIRYVHEIMTPGMDPYVPISKVPPGHTRAIRLGDDEAMFLPEKPFPFNHQMIRNTFTVTPEKPAITYWYAVVFSQQRSQPHGQADQPYFRIRMFDKDGNEIKCASYDVDITRGVKGGFVTKIINNTIEAVYKDWVPVYIPLINNINEKVTIQFESSDCNVGGHVGYAYLAVDCNPYKAITTSPFICGTNTVQLTAPDGSNSYKWTGPGVILPDTTQTISANKPGKYTVTMTVIGNYGITCTFYLDTVIAGTSIMPVADFSNTTVCAGNPTVFTDLSTEKGAITDWEWDFNNDGKVDSKIQNPSYTFPEAGTFDVKLYVKQGPCDATITKKITVAPNPELKITNPPPVCHPGTIDITKTFTVTGNIGSGTVSYWADTAATKPLSTPNAISVSGTYYIKIVSTFGCSDIKPVKVTIVQLPVLLITDPAPVCLPYSVDITATAITNGSSAGTFSYWKDSTATIALPNPQSVTVSGTYYIRLQTGNCEIIKPVKVVINPLPISNAGPDVVICTGEIASLGTNQNTDYSYSWIPSTGLNAADISNPTVTLTNSGTTPNSTIYIVTTTNSLTGCTTKDSVTVTVNPLVAVDAGKAASVCPGVKTKLNGSIGGAATSARWSGGQGKFDDPTKLDTYYTPTEAEIAIGTVTLTLTTNDPEGPCPAASSDIVLNFYKNPTVHYTVDKKNGCPVHCVNFTDSSYVEGSTDYIDKWSWDFGDSYSNPKDNKSNLQKPSHCYANPGFYDIKLTVTSNHGCQSSYTTPKMIEVFNIPVAEFYPTPNPASLLNPTVTLKNGSSADVIEWYYQFGDGDSVSPHVSSPVHKYPEIASQSYLAKLKVKNKGGCIATVEHIIEIGPEFTFYIPNAFTPDGDGVNDFFSGKGIGIVKYDFVIFDRWGNLIFHSENLDDQWDGRANNGKEIAQQDVYVWKVKLTDIFGKKHDYIGTVTLVR